MSEINTEQSTTNLDGDKILVTVEPVMKTAVDALSALGKTGRLTIIGKGESCPNAVAVSNILTQKMLKGNSKIEFHIITKHKTVIMEWPLLKVEMTDLFKQKIETLLGQSGSITIS